MPKGQRAPLETKLLKTNSPTLDGSASLSYYCLLSRRYADPSRVGEFVFRGLVPGGPSGLSASEIEDPEGAALGFYIARLWRFDSTQAPENREKAVMLVHSVRRAIIGSTFVARRAGR